MLSEAPDLPYVLATFRHLGLAGLLQLYRCRLRPSRSARRAAEKVRSEELGE